MTTKPTPCPVCATPLPVDGVCPNCATSAVPATIPQTDQRRKVADRYALIRRLGVGGMGEVWLAEDTRLGVQVALKFIAPRLATDDEIRRRFHREILLARQVRHPNVAAVYDLFEDGENVFFTMEYVPGTTLDQVLGERPTVDRGLKLIRDMCQGLAALHAAGVVHRDVKPHNVKVTPDGRAVLLDLGIAKDLASTEMTHPGMVIGTPDHMAPEQFTGQEVTPAADVFCVGLILYRLLTGTRIRPMEATPSTGSRSAIQKPSATNPEIPEWLDSVVMKCLEPNPDKRYPDAGALLGDLEAERRRTTQQTVTMRRRTLFGVTAGVGIALAVVAAIVAIVVVSRHRPPALLARRLTSAVGLECGGCLSNDGKLLTYSAMTDGHFHLFLRTAMQEGEALQLTHTQGLDEIEPALSHDGALLAFAASGPGGGIGVVPATGGAIRWVLPIGARPRWSPDDKQLAIETGHVEPPARDVLVIPLEGGEEPRSLRGFLPTPATVHDGDWLDQHTMLAVVGSNEIWRFDLDSGTAQRTLIAVAAVRDLCADPATGEAAFLLAGADGWQPHLWRSGSNPEPVGGGGYSELSWFRNRSLVLTRAEPEMMILSATLDAHGRIEPTGIKQIETTTESAGREQREFMPELAPDGSMLAFISSRSGTFDVWLKEMHRRKVQRVSKAGGTNRWPAFSPDGKLLAYCSMDVGGGDVLIYDVAAGKTTNLTRSLDYEGAPDWFPDGRSLAVNVKHQGQWDIGRVSYPDGKVSLMTSSPSVDIDPAVSPDGKLVAFTRDGVLHLLHVADGTLVPLVAGATSRWRADGRELLYQADGDLWAIAIPYLGEVPTRLTYHPWTARHLEGVWKFSVRGNRVIYSIEAYPSGDVVLLAPEASKGK